VASKLSEMGFIPYYMWGLSYGVKAGPAREEGVDGGGEMLHEVFLKARRGWSGDMPEGV
jgi:hypothetical protein